jgi:four helix bundle protein
VASEEITLMGRTSMGAAEKPRHYKDLLIWQKGMALAKFVYRPSARFPVERYGLISQIRRAAVSVPSNIAEGQARHTTKEFLQFLSHATGSLAEVETQLLLAVELSFANAEGVAPGLKEIDELQKMIVSLQKKLESGSPLATRHSPLAPGRSNGH